MTDFFNSQCFKDYTDEKCQCGGCHKKPDECPAGEDLLKEYQTLTGLEHPLGKLMFVNLRRDYQSLGLGADGVPEMVLLCLGCLVAYMKTFNSKLAAAKIADPLPAGTGDSPPLITQEMLREYQEGMALAKKAQSQRKTLLEQVAHGSPVEPGPLTVHVVVYRRLVLREIKPQGSQPLVPPTSPSLATDPVAGIDAKIDDMATGGDSGGAGGS